jgi:hypothetical protein
MNFLNYAYFLLLFIGTLIGFRYFNSLSTSFKFLALLFLATALDEYIAYYFEVKYGNNSPIYNIFIIIQYALIGGIYFYSPLAGKYIKYFIVITIIAFTFICIYRIVHFNKLWTFSLKLLQIESALILVMVLNSFWQIIRDKAVISLHHRGIFWVNMAFLFFQSIALLIWSFYDVLVCKSELYFITMNIFSSINLLFYSTLIAAIFVELNSIKNKDIA